MSCVLIILRRQYRALKPPRAAEDYGSRGGNVQRIDLTVHGMDTRKSLFSLIFLPIPSPSLPKTMALGTLKSASVEIHAACLCREYPQSLFLKRLYRLRNVCDFTIAICSMAPAEDFTTVGVMPQERRLGIISPCAPAHSARRIRAPMLCGSSMPSAITKKRLFASFLGNSQGWCLSV